MPTDIRNETEFQGEIGKILEGVITAVSDKISKKLQSQIEKDVYTTTNTWYNRTGEFERAWKWKDIKRTVSAMTRELYYDSDSVKWDKENWIHGNPGRSAAENLEDILNLAWTGYRDGYTSSMIWRKDNKPFSHKRRPYWENFVDDLFDGGELDKMFDEAFANSGLNVQRV